MLEENERYFSKYLVRGIQDAVISTCKKKLEI